MLKKRLKCKAVFFDLWGTLMQMHAVTHKTQLAMGLGHYSFHYFIQRFERAVLKKRFASLQQFVLAAFKGFGLQPKERQIKKICLLWRRHMRKARPFAEAIPVLRALKKHGFKIALITNCQDFGLHALLKRFRLLQFFDSVQLSFEAHLLKPDKRIFQRALRSLHLKPRDAIMVGDSNTDIIGARAAGMRGILIDRKARRKKCYKAVAVINNLNGLLRLLEVG